MNEVNSNSSCSEEFHFGLQTRFHLSLFCSSVTLPTLSTALIFSLQGANIPCISNSVMRKNSLYYAHSIFMPRICDKKYYGITGIILLRGTFKVEYGKSDSDKYLQKFISLVWSRLKKRNVPKWTNLQN